MVAWLRRTWHKLFGGGLEKVVTQVPAHICPACGQEVPEKTVETPDYEHWTPEPAPPEKVERNGETLDHVFAAHTYYHVASAKAGAYDRYPRGEGNPDSFVILRSSRKLPEQVDEKGSRIRQLDLDRLEDLADKCYLLTSKGETPLENVFDLDRASDEEFANLWLEGNDGDMAYWSARPAEAEG